MKTTVAEHHYDARGLVCPLPVLRARKILQGMPAGAVLRVSVTDKSSPHDFKLFCAEAGYRLAAIEDKGDATDVIIEKIS